ncbi:MAG: tricarballylate utilization 4Fe-4S protein TcuB [Hyphomicrobiales bacterium]
MHATDLLGEGARVLTICNACRYCEGLCPVFPTLQKRPSFDRGDLEYLANLCHGCGACYYDCQYATPHEFAVDVPRTLSGIRIASYEHHAWPKALAPLFRRNGVAITLLASLAVTAFIAGFVWLRAPDVLFGVHTGPGAFYKVMPHNWMVAIFGGVFAYALMVMAIGGASFWRGIPRPAQGSGLGGAEVLRTAGDAARLRYMDGGGAGCMNRGERPSPARRVFHQFTLFGFLLCFAATSVATLFHYIAGWEAPYPWYTPPVLLGIAGGIGLLVGPAGLLHQKLVRDRALEDNAHRGMDTAFILMLFLVSLTGFALLIFRETAAMGLLLAIHLGVVFGLFLALPYSKFVHAVYRTAALLRFNGERRVRP